MVFELFRGAGESQVDLIEKEIATMLATSSETFRMALDALTRRTDPASIGKTLRKRDRSINKVERAIRRRLIVHAGVRGALADAPALFVYMSIAKDIERVGDLAKDMWDLAAAGADMSQGELKEAADQVGEKVLKLIDDTARVFGERDAEAAIDILNASDMDVDHYEAQMLAQMKADNAADAVAVALFYRYAARITAHLMNVLTAVVMPFERLDYWDEDKVDRDDLA
ncbi:MAG TPA: PhoU domain-containing protein [Acidimicrobiia bacterium]|jgi:phosphate transport system protein|nr:PhoU domain-containing protein [Acidimicrobiia bacterium]